MSAPAIAGSSGLSDDVLAERLMLAICSYGANSGVKAVAAAGGGLGHSEDGIGYVRRRCLSPQVVQSIAIDIATFAARDLAPVGGRDHRRGV